MDNRAEAIDILTRMSTNHFYGHREQEALKLGAEALSAERRGRWIRTGEDGYCSVCKCDMPMFRNDWEWEYTETPYCPNCGTRMDGEEE